MRTRRKMITNPKLLLLSFALLSSCAFTYLSFHEAKTHHEHVAAGHREHFPLSVLTWLKTSKEGTRDRNVVNREFNFVIIVLAYNRLDSLRRCLKSLQVADYGGDNVNLVIHVDHFKPSSSTRRSLLAFNNSEEYEEGDIQSMEEILPEIEEVDFSNDPVERSLQESRQILSFLDKFKWKHGSKQVHYRMQNMGIQGQWLEAWWPSSDHQFALVVEDDMQLSPLFYRYVRSIIANYYYNNYDPSVFGISLQRPRFVPGKGGNRIDLSNTTRLFLYQMVGSWGQILFPKPWKEFILWFDTHKTKGIEPSIEGLVTTDWYRRLGDKIWTPWFVKFAHSRGYFNIYTNFLKERALSVSHRSTGVNYKKEAGPDSKLIKRKGLTDIDLWEMPVKLEWYDFCFHKLLMNRLVNFSEYEGLQKLLPTVHSNGQVIVLSTTGIEESVVRNWLCQVSTLGIENILLLGDGLKHGEELARRGYAMLVDEDSDAVRSSVRTAKLVLELGYDVWLVRPQFVWLSQDVQIIHSLPESRHKSMLFAAGVQEEEYYAGFFFLRSGQKSRVFMQKLEDSLLDLDNSWKAFGRLIWRVTTEMGSDIGRFNARFSKNWTVTNGEDSGIILLEHLEVNDSLEEQLKESGLWTIDEELACKRVSCRH